MSQADRILEVLKDGQPHSSAEIIERAYDVTRLYAISFSRRISDLRQRGRDIRQARIIGSRGHAYQLMKSENVMGRNCLQ